MIILKDLSQQVEELPNNCLIAAAFISFLSNEPEDKKRVSKIKISFSRNYIFPSFKEGDGTLVQRTWYKAFEY
ncbi:hypothetical protein NQ314_021230 [Rhamnusium bicolor]|uniref:Uncharacterized protein n=1 Tax=Rhamnusium bicolor TaxID=1586634 RepID=A0AAV8WKX0_9CUCU|nr:hypothetical protein NQ314_021230 [Rhamnusium bicolor]